MQITMWVSGFFEWEKVPQNVDTASAEFKRAKARGLVKPTGGRVFSGTNADLDVESPEGWLMRVVKTLDTHSDINAPENDLIEVIIQEMTRGDRRIMTRAEAIGRLVGRHNLQHLCHRSHIDFIEVDDDGPDEKFFREKLAPHVECGNIDELDIEELVEKYTKPMTSDDIAKHLETSFGVRPKKSARRRLLVSEQRAEIKRVMDHHQLVVNAKHVHLAPKDEEGSQP